MRCARIKADGAGYYHGMSRIIGASEGHTIKHPHLRSSAANLCSIGRVTADARGSTQISEPLPICVHLRSSAANRSALSEG